ncbi:MAG: ATP-binding protein [Bacteroidales bacterium]|nr:ATP-binding protein [Bacteroidales bacterium]
MKYYKRYIDSELLKWKNSETHKPLLLRGARQVGKSSAVKNLAKSFKYYIEINFERQNEISDIFSKGYDIQKICNLLSIIFNTPINDGETLIFFDEIQKCIPAISSLRFFYEDKPNLHVIGAGSLLEFALNEIPSFGVGRIHSLFMYPFSFDEFLIAQGFENLVNEKHDASPQNPLPNILHNKLVEEFKNFILVGGMPEVVSIWIKSQNYFDCQNIHSEIIQSYQDDFAKYKKRISPLILQKTFLSVGMQTGSKFTYSQIDTNIDTSKAKEAINLLTLAGIIIPVTHTCANGIPLGAQINEKFQKYLFIDSGLMLTMLGTDLSKFVLANEVELVNKGGVAELVAGLELLKNLNCNRRQNLYYWQRLQRGAQSEIDYVIANKDQVLPIEIKAGTKGSMQSLYIFLEEKKLEYGIRSSLENFAEYNKVKVIPLYEIGRLGIINN